MYLGNVTIKQSTTVSQSIVGNFISPNKTDLIIVKGISRLELIHIERTIISNSFSSSASPLQFETLISLETFSHIRKIAPMKDTYTKKDNVVVLSDSGKLIIFEIDINKKKFVRINQEIYGKTGCRRITPGEYLAIDNKSRSLMIGGIEKEKFVYIFKEIDNNLVLNANFEENKNLNMNNNDISRKIISSPLEVFTPQHICYDIIALDVGYTNPIFASIEVKYNNTQDWISNNYELNAENQYQKKLLLYQVEIKNNYIIKLLQHPIDNTAYSLFPINYEKKSNISSQNKSLQGTFLIFCKGFFYLMRVKENKINREEKIYFEKTINNNNINKINDKNNQIMIINKSVFITQDKDNDEYNLICQSQFGDIYHIIFKVNQKPLEIYDYFIYLIFNCSTGSTMSIIDNYLFLGKETSDSEIYLISQNKTINKDEKHSLSQKINLKKEININSLNSLIDFKYGNYDSSGLQKFFALSGNKDESYLKSLNIKTIYNISQLSNNKIPAQPVNIWVIKKNYEDDFHSLVVLSFVNKTLVYEIEHIDKTLKELQNNFFETKLPSLHVSIVKDNSFLQVLPNGILHIKTEKKTTFLKSSSTICCASATNNQLVVGLENKELLYFEFDNTLTKPDIKVIGKKISLTEFCPIDEGIFKSKYIAICIDDSTINILSLEKDKLFFMASTIKIPDNVASMKIIQNDKHYSHSFMAFVGLTNGVLVMINFSRAPGNTQFQTQIQTKFIGEEELKLYKLNLDANNLNNNFNNLLYYDSIMICDNKNSFLCRLNEKQDNYVDYNIKKINTKEGINYACNCIVKNKETKINENISLIAQKKNIILGKIQHDNISPINLFKLLYNPKAIILTLNHNFIILETYREIINNNDEKWNSCIQIINMKNNKCELLNEIKFENEYITSYYLIENYYANTDKQLLLIATGKNYKSYPIKKYSIAYVYLYDIYLDIKNNYSFTINLKFKDKIESLSTALCEYQNKILCGMYKELILYEIGKEHLLKKSRSNIVKEEIISLSINGDRILALTRRSSIYILKYNEFNALFYTVIADDFYTRYIHKVKFLDYDTIVGSDKFENFFIYRIPKDQYNSNYDSGRHAIKDSMTGFMTNSNDSFLHAANLKLVLMNEIHLGEIITELQTIKIKEDFDNNNEEENENSENSNNSNNMNTDDEMDENRIKAILYGTLGGGVGMFIQFNKKEDALFFAQMELLLREYIDEPTGRNIMIAKSQYIPVKNIIDFSLIYEYFNIEPSLQKKIAEELGDKPVNEIKNKISEIRNLFQ